jgi:putative flippase GtrA
MDHVTATSASVGVSASVIAVITSFQQEIEWWVRISTSVIGLMIAIVSLYIMVRKAFFIKPDTEDEK